MSNSSHFTASLFINFGAAILTRERLAQMKCQRRSVLRGDHPNRLEWGVSNALPHRAAERRAGLELSLHFGLSNGVQSTDLASPAAKFVLATEAQVTPIRRKSPLCSFPWCPAIVLCSSSNPFPNEIGQKRRQWRRRSSRFPTRVLQSDQV